MRQAPKEDLDARRASFLSAPANYARTRPGYPIEAIKWVVGEAPRLVIDLGCGPGNLTSPLVELGHVAVGVDPSIAMLRGMADKRLPRVCGAAESIPVQTGCADVVTAATAFHWFDPDRAVPEMRRVLRAGGLVGLLTNIRDETVGWVKDLSEIIGSEVAKAVASGGIVGIEAEFVSRLERNGLFRSTQYRTFDFEHELTGDKLLGLVRSRSYIAILPDTEREALLDEVRVLCRTHPQLAGRDTFSMPYKTHVFRSTAA